MGIDFNEEIPEDMKEQARMEPKSVEAVAEYDEKLLEKYFEDPDSITEEEMLKRFVKQRSMSDHSDDVWFCI